MKLCPTCEAAEAAANAAMDVARRAEEAAALADAEYGAAEDAHLRGEHKVENPAGGRDSGGRGDTTAVRAAETALAAANPSGKHRCEDADGTWMPDHAANPSGGSALEARLAEAERLLREAMNFLVDDISMEPRLIDRIGDFLPTGGRDSGDSTDSAEGGNRPGDGSAAANPSGVYRETKWQLRRRAAEDQEGGT